MEDFLINKVGLDNALRAIAGALWILENSSCFKLLHPDDQSDIKATKTGMESLVLKYALPDPPGHKPTRGYSRELIEGRNLLEGAR